MKPRSLREIQVSSSQLALIFLALLAIAAVIFLLGVSVGKKSVETAQQEIGEEKISPAWSEPEEKETPSALTAKKEEKELPAEKTPTGAGIARTEKVEPTLAPPEPTTKKLETAPGQTFQTSLTPATKADLQKKTSAAGKYFIQVAAFSKKEAAAGLVQSLSRLGYPVRVLPPFPTDKNPFYRVRVGPYQTYQEAVKVRDQVRASLRQAEKAFIVRD